MVENKSELVQNPSSQLLSQLLITIIAFIQFVQSVSQYVTSQIDIPLYSQYTQHTISFSNLYQSLIYINQPLCITLYEALHKTQYTMVPKKAVIFCSIFLCN